MTGHHPRLSSADRDAFDALIVELLTNARPNALRLADIIERVKDAIRVKRYAGATTGNVERMVDAALQRLRRVKRIEISRYRVVTGNGAGAPGWTIVVPSKGGSASS